MKPGNKSFIFILPLFCTSDYYYLEKPTADPVYEEPEGFKLQEVSTEPEYEKPEALCKLHKNIAYEISPSGIKTAQNEAYAAVANTSLEI